LEQYLWGYGEMAGGVENHSKALIVAARSYARWWIEYATKWDMAGFDLIASPFNQIYNGYDYEIAHPLVADAAHKTNGILMKYGSEYVLGAYSSNTDGATRALAGYPYLVSVPDPYGKIDNPAPGNHMWGMSANGSLVLARDYSWQWSRILSYYYSKIDIVKEY
jgi:peptidoglycan hydrolase-like amidase